MVVDFKILRKQNFSTIKPGDKIKYLKGDKHIFGFVKLIKSLNVITLINPINKFSWDLNLSTPSLKVWVLPIKLQQKLRKDKERIYKLYLEGKLKQVSSLPKT